MALRVFNTLSRSVQDFTPLDPAGKRVGLYCCGPTVHDFAHIGNFRTFVFADLVRRYLEFKGYAVTHVMNITDVEDKIIKRVREQGVKLTDFTREREQAFLEDLATLGCQRPTQIPRATEYIGEMIALIGKLLERGVAYQAPDKSIYFSIEKYRGCGCNYGQLQKLNFEAMRVGERVSSDEYEKESVADFALWKARAPEDGEVFWDSPWGQGRPGWHIECSAMSMKLLGESFDLHLGGEDLIFPHHEDEIAQSEGATGQPFVKYWMHGAHLLVEGKKMSKSLGNFFTLRDLVAKGFSGREIRYLLLSSHYRETFNFTLEGLAGARTALARIDECISKLSHLAALFRENATEPAPLPEGFEEALDQDLNVSGAWGSLFGWIKEMNRRLAADRISPREAKTAMETFGRIGGVLGVGAVVNMRAQLTGEGGLVADLEVTYSELTEMAELLEISPDQLVGLIASGGDAPTDVLELALHRQAARKAKDFKRSDAIRDELKAKGWVIEDTPKGPRLKKL